MKKISFFSTGKKVLGQLPPEENFTSILALTLKLNQTQTPTRGWWQFSFGGNKRKRNEKPKRNKKQWNKEKINKTSNGKFYQIKETFSEN